MLQQFLFLTIDAQSTEVTHLVYNLFKQKYNELLHGNLERL